MTADMDLLAFVKTCIVLTISLVTSTSESNVYIKDVIGDGDLPEITTIALTFSSLHPTINIHLRKSAVSQKIPVFHICKIGKSLCQEKLNKQGIIIYENSENKASLSVVRHYDSWGRSTLRWQGTVTINNVAHVIQPEQLGNSSSLSHTISPMPNFSRHNVIGAQSDIDSFAPYIHPSTNEVLMRRTRRRSATNVNIGILVIIDNLIIDTWMKRSTGLSDAVRRADARDQLLRYFALVVHGMDLRFRGIGDPRYVISITLSGYLIDTNDVSRPDFMTTTTKTELDLPIALDLFQTWADGANLFPKFDHVMLFTGHELYQMQEGVKVMDVTGMAYPNKMCTKHSFSIIEYQGGFSSIRTATHELGHSLGASHDGDGNRCDSRKQFIMARQSKHSDNSTLQANSWRFSRCSIDAFASFINNLRNSAGRRCVFDQAKLFNDKKWKSYVKTEPGQLFTVDDICRQLLGKESFMCRDLLDAPEDICIHFWCNVPYTDKCRQLSAPRGTSCGNYKWCVAGACIYDAKAPKVDGNCVHGDHTGVLEGEKITNMSCEELVTSQPFYCYQKLVRKRCCSLCQKHYRPYKGCEYGNRQKKCVRAWCSITTEQRPQVLKQCCETCQHGMQVGRGTTQPQCLDNLVNCAALVSMARHLCSAKKYRQYCCISCKSSKPGSGIKNKDTTEFPNKMTQPVSRAPTLYSVYNILFLTCSVIFVFCTFNKFSLINL